MKRRNKIILSIYLIYVAGILLTGFINPSMNWKEKIFVIGFMLMGTSFFAFMIYLILNKVLKDQSEPQRNIVAKIFWKKYRKPFTLSFYLVGILVSGTSVFSLPDFSLTWKFGVFAVMFLVMSGGFFAAYKVTNHMLQK